MFTPVDLPENSPVRAEFYKKVAGKDLSEVKSIWSKLVFTGKAAAPKEYQSAAEVKKAIAKVGHDNDEVKSSKETYQKLPDCCQYDRTLQLK